MHVWSSLITLNLFLKNNDIELYSFMALDKKNNCHKMAMIYSQLKQLLSILVEDSLSCDDNNLSLILCIYPGFRYFRVLTKCRGFFLLIIKLTDRNVNLDNELFFLFYQPYFEKVAIISLNLSKQQQRRNYEAQTTQYSSFWSTP